MLTKITGTGDGSAPVVNLTFPFIDKSHVKATVDGGPVALTWTGASQVTFAATVAAGLPWVVYRQTPNDNSLVNFTDGSVLTEEDLDKAHLQHIYRDQELNDIFDPGFGHGDMSLDAAGTRWSIKDGAVGALQIADGAVTENEIANNGVSTVKLQDKAVTLPKLADLAAGTILGNNGGAPGTPLALNPAQVAAMLPVATAGAKGLLPVLSGDPTETLKGDGSFGPTPMGPAGPPGDVARAADRAAIKALTPGGTVLTRWLAEAGREGVFEFDSSDLSAEVVTDTVEGLYLAPASDPTGASGAWVRKFDGFVNVKWFGAKGDGSTDDHAAVQVAIEYLVTQGGGTLFFPPGDYHSSAALDLAGHWNIRLFGGAGSGPGFSAPPSAQLVYTGSGGRFIDARNSVGIALSNIGVRYTNAAFTGNLVDFTNITGGADTAYGLVERSLLAGDDAVGAVNAGTLINLGGAIIMSVIDSVLNMGTVGIKGTHEVAPGNVIYSNAVVIQRTTFMNLSVSALLDAGQAWTITGNTFENGPRAYYATLSAGAITSGLSFIGNWLGDGVDVTDTWFSNGSTELRGAQIIGNFFDTSWTSVPGIKLTHSTSGVLISGNSIGYALDLGSVDHYGLTVTGNFLGLNEVVNLSNNSTDITITSNKMDGGFAKSWIRTSKTQDFKITGTPIPTFTAPTATDIRVQLQADTGQSRMIHFMAGGTNRALIGTDSAAGGEDFVLVTYDNLGGFTGYALRVNRTTMDAAFGGGVSANGPVTVTHPSSGAGVTAPLDVKVNTGHADGLRTRFKVENNPGQANVDVNFLGASINIGSSSAAVSAAGTAVTFLAPTGDTSMAMAAYQPGQAIGGLKAWEFNRNGGFTSYAYGAASVFAQWMATSDANPRLSITDGHGGGTINWGPGGATATDTNLYRDGVGALKTDGIFTVGGAGLGYGTGAGGTVTQATSKSTGVAINKAAGQITTHNAALAAAAVVSFTVTNSTVAAADGIVLTLKSGNATAGTYRYWVEAVAAGSFKIVIENRSGGSLSEALVFNYQVVKGATA